ncbi:hypothetical protein K493DRAFT_311689 [Basidiobolus meristosporus CBS 931.73]|uniref:Uncharacterized protein n=1 Tax=Basidiobolus meristosporus CBS 931.73 TaxID=1314790 RepID=A0A1Y1YZR7_9FUNG|nr:hypothetical protein K493DRAFT_311689 [Basidiobolus meristosporus CBS 931.73]|eukprot:ORY03540.1 hypothetical protein K493DRAFT_311689 [Basidiobolus meristosporus CBS 931.73]
MLTRLEFDTKWVFTFQVEVKEQPETETTSNEPSFVPNYITSPDLGKLWSIPDDVVEPRVKLPFEKLEQAFSTKEDKPQPSNEASPSLPASPYRPNQVKELLISLESQNSHTVLGAIFIPPSASVSKAVEMIREEIDNVPTNFKVARYNKDRQQTVPISTKQMEHPISRHFRAEGEQLVLIPL